MITSILANYFTTDHPQPFISLEVGINDEHRDNSKFRVSDAGKCQRMRYFKRQGKPGQRELSLEMQMILQTGHLLHAFVQHALRDQEVLVAAEQKLEDEHRIGHLDAIVKAVTLEGFGDLILYDVKTVGGKQMYYLQQKPTPTPKPEHIAQVLTYLQMYVVSGAASACPHECRICYINRDTLEILDLPVPDRANLTDMVTRDWGNLINYWDRQETPPMTSLEWECRYCQYKADCLPGG